MVLHRRHRIPVVATRPPDMEASVAKINQLAHQLAIRDRPPAIDRSFGGSILPALQEIADTTASELEWLGVRYRMGLRSLLAVMGRRTIATVSADAEYSDRLHDVASAEASHRTAHDRLVASQPEKEFSGRSAKPIVMGVYLLVGGLTEGLLTSPVATAMGLTGTEIILTQFALGAILTLAAVLGGWLAAYAHYGSRDRRIIAAVSAGLLLSGLMLLQARLAPIRGQVVAGNINSILNFAAHGHITVTTVSPEMATQFFQTLGRDVVGLGAVEGYLFRDPLTSGYRRTSRALTRARTAVTRSRVVTIVQSVEETVDSASYQQYRAIWVAAAQFLQAAGSAAMSRYLGTVSALSDEDTRAALYEARRPPIPLPSWVMHDHYTRTFGLPSKDSRSLSVRP